MGIMVANNMASRPTLTVSALFGVRGNVGAMVGKAVRCQPTSPDQFSMPVESYGGEAALFGTSNLASIKSLTATAALSMLT